MTLLFFFLRGHNETERFRLRLTKKPLDKTSEGTTVNAALDKNCEDQKIIRPDTSLHSDDLNPTYDYDGSLGWSESRVGPP